MSKGNDYWTGQGRIWVNDKDWDRVKSFELKMAIEWEDIPIGLTVERAMTGYSYEGSFSYRKTDKNYNNAIDLLFEDYSKGIIPEVSIVGKAYNKATGETQRIKVSGITFDELELQKFEEKTIAEVEMPFKASEVKILQ